MTSEWDETVDVVVIGSGYIFGIPTTPPVAGNMFHRD